VEIVAVDSDDNPCIGDGSVIGLELADVVELGLSHNHGGCQGAEGVGTRVKGWETKMGGVNFWAECLDGK